jgi:hypothetical protein
MERVPCAAYLSVLVLSTMHNAQCNSFNTPPSLVPAKALCHLRQCKHHSKFAGGLWEVLKIQPQMISESIELDFTQVLDEHVSGIHLSGHEH